MTEAEWFTSDNPGRMTQLQLQASERKRRLFACACCRHIWHLITDDRSRRVVDVAERFADGLATSDQLDAAAAAAYQAAIGEDEHNPGGYAVCYVYRESLDLEEASRRTRMCFMGKFPDRYAEQEALGAEAQAQCMLLRELFGNPFRPAAISPTWLAWNDNTVHRIAQAIYAERAFDRLPILADALEDAGCDNADILNHCRSGGEHVRGCWVVDLLLGKS